MYHFTTLLTLALGLLSNTIIATPAPEAIAVVDAPLVERAVPAVAVVNEGEVKLEARDPKKKKISSSNDGNTTDQDNAAAGSEIDRRNAIGMGVVVGGVALAMGML